MRFLLVAQTLRNRALLQKIESEGHEVAFLSPLTDPLIKSFQVPRQALEWNPDYVMFLEPGMGDLAKTIKAEGFKVFNGSVYHDCLHNDPDYANELASRIRVPIMPIDNGGVHMYLAGFYNGKHFCGPALSYSLDYGLTDCIGKNIEAVTVHSLPHSSKLVQETFVKLETLFAAIKFCGIIFIDVQIEPETQSPHIHRVSVSIPDGFIPAFLAGLEQDVSLFIKGITSKKISKFKFTREISGAVKVSLPPYPHSTVPWVEDQCERVAIEEALTRPSKGVQVPDHGNFYGINVERSENGYTTTGPEVGYVTAVDDLQSLPYVIQHYIDELCVGDLQYRSSVGKELATSLAYFEDYKVLASV